MKGRKRTRTFVIEDNHTEQTLSEVEKAFRDRFLRFYIQDFNGKNALRRMGFTNENTLRSYPSQLFREPYVQNKLHELVRVLQPTDIVSRNQVLAGMWKEANTAAMSNDRISALANLGKMLGMYQHQEEKKEDSMPVGVMLVPIMRPDDWEASASLAQAMLKRQAAETVTQPSGLS